MAIPPSIATMLLPLGIEGIGQAARAAAVASPTDLDRRNRERLARLQRRAEMDLLGLTDREEEVIRTQANQQRSAARRALEADRRASLAATGAGGGTELAQALAAEQAEMRGQQAIGDAIAAADIEERRREEDEIEALIAAEAQRQVQRRTAGADALIAMGDVAAQELVFQRLTGQDAVGPGTEAGSAAAAQASSDEAERLRREVAELARAYGTDSEEIERWLGYKRDNQHLARED